MFEDHRQMNFRTFSWLGVRVEEVLQSCFAPMLQIFGQFKQKCTEYCIFPHCFNAKGPVVDIGADYGYSSKIIVLTVVSFGMSRYQFSQSLSSSMEFK